MVVLLFTLKGMSTQSLYQLDWGKLTQTPDLIEDTSGKIPTPEFPVPPTCWVLFILHCFECSGWS